MAKPDEAKEAMLQAVLAEDTKAQLSLLGAIRVPNSRSMVDDPILDAKIAAAEARTDTKFAELRGDLAERFGRLDTELAKKPGTGTLIGIAVAIVAVLLAALAFAGGRFDAGISAGGALAPYAEQQRARDTAQDHKLDEILKRLPPPKR